MLVLVVVGVVLATRTPQQATAVQSPLLGRTAPQFTGTDLSTGSRVSLLSLRGHYVVINFFASWCIPCQEEAPDLSRFHYEQSHAADGADMVSVVFHDTSDTAQRLPASERRPLARRERPRRCDRPELWGDGAAHDLCHRSLGPCHRGARGARDPEEPRFVPGRRQGGAGPCVPWLNARPACRCGLASRCHSSSWRWRSPWAVASSTPHPRQQVSAPPPSKPVCAARRASMSRWPSRMQRRPSRCGTRLRAWWRKAGPAPTSTRCSCPSTARRSSWCRPTLAESPSSGSFRWSRALARWWASAVVFWRRSRAFDALRTEETVR